MAITESRIGYNVQVQYSTASAFTSPVTIGEVTDCKPPSVETKTHDGTHLQSANKMMEKIAGLVELGACTLKVSYAPDGSVAGAAHIALGAAAKARTHLFFKILIPTAAGAVGSGSTNTIGPFGAFLKYEPGNWNNNGPIDCTLTLTLSGYTDAIITNALVLPA